MRAATIVAAFAAFSCAPPSARDKPIVVRHPKAKPIVSLHLAPGKQETRTVVVCDERPAEPSAWEKALQAQGFVVQLGWLQLHRFGVRFRRASDGIYGDLYSEWHDENQKSCVRYVVRLQRARVPGSPERWTTPFSIHSPDQPNWYFSDDPAFPAGY